VRPLKANPPLGVYPDAVLPISVALERLKAVARERCEIEKARSGVENFEPFLPLSMEALELPDKLTSRVCLGSPIAITQDHPTWRYPY
jgi:hypothetical protein